MPFLWLKCGEIVGKFIIRSDDKFKIKGDGSVCQVFSLDASTVKINGTAVPSGADGWTEVTVTELGFVNTSEQTPLAVTGAAAAGPSSAATTGGAAAGPWTNSAGGLTGVFQGLSISSEGGTVESIIFPSQACFVAFTVFNNSSVALQLASHARAVIACGQVSHKSPTRSDFTLVFAGNIDGRQRMSQFLRYLWDTAITSKVKLLRSGAEVRDEAAVRFEAGGDGQASQDAEHLRMLGSSLDVQYATPQLQLSMEREQVQEERQARSRSHSLGRSSERSAEEE